MIQCRKTGLVTMQYCSACPDWENAKEGNPYGNSEQTCTHFGKIVRDSIEQAQLGVEFKHETGWKQKEGDTVIIKVPAGLTKRDPRLTFGSPRKTDIPMEEPKKIDYDWFESKKKTVKETPEGEL